MLRQLYIRVLHLHPARFKYRFGDEMLSIFDEMYGRESVLPLFVDAFASVFRQRFFRWGVNHRHPAAVASGGDGVPVFYTIEDYHPRKTALLNGGVLTIALLMSLVYMIRVGGIPRGLMIGSHHPSHSHLLTARPAASADELNTELTTEVKMRPDAAILEHDPMRPVVVGYYRAIVILDALDTNHDLLISSDELKNAPAVLAAMDANGDGQISRDEISQMLDRFRPAFMRVNPVLAAIDLDHNGVISRSEIADAARSLRALDQNHDGNLSWREVLPEPVAFEVFLLFRLDENGDGRISRQERLNPFRLRFAVLNQQLLDAADTDHDGSITEIELGNEIKRRADLNGDGHVTWEELVEARRNGVLGPRR